MAWGLPEPACHPDHVHHVDLGLLVLRLAIGLTLVAHGTNKFFGGGRIPGTARWFESMGVRPGRPNAILAASTEVVAGLGVAAGLFTPLSAAGVIALMLVAIVVSHRKNGFFIFRPGEGWEYCAVLALAAFSIATIGAGAWSLDHALGPRRRGVGRGDHRRRRRPRRRRAAAGGLLPAAGAGRGSGIDVVVTQPTLDEPPAARRPRWGVRAVLLAVVAALVAMWIYVLFIGKEQSPNRLADQEWAKRAEPVCAATAKRLAALPAASTFAQVKPLEEALRRRADVGEQATALLDGQLAQLRALPAPTGPHDGVPPPGLVRRLGPLPGRPPRPHRQLAGRPRQALRRERGQRRPDQRPHGLPLDAERHAQLRRARRLRLISAADRAAVPAWATAHGTGFQPSPSTWRRMTRAGAPTATQWSGRSPTTTEFAPTTTWRPMRAPGSTTVP